MAIMPAWVRLRDTGREPQSVQHCNVQRYRGTVILLEFGGFSPGDPHLSDGAMGRAARTGGPDGGHPHPAPGARDRGSGCKTSASCKRQGPPPSPLLPRWERDRSVAVHPRELGPLSSVVCHSHN